MNPAPEPLGPTKSKKNPYKYRKQKQIKANQIQTRNYRQIIQKPTLEPFGPTRSNKINKNLENKNKSNQIKSNTGAKPPPNYTESRSGAIGTYKVK